MPGGVEVREPFLFVGFTNARGRIATYDLRENRRVRAFEFADPETSRGSAAGLAVGEAFEIFVADPLHHRVRRFTLFGMEVGRCGALYSGNGRLPDRRGTLAAPNDVALDGEGYLYVACGSEPLVHGVQKFAPDGRCVGAFRAFGEGGEKFGAPRGIAVYGDRAAVADTENGCVQVFTTAGVFLFVFSTATGPAERSLPTAVAPAPSGALLVAQRGEESCLKAFTRGGDLERILVPGGSDEGELDDPDDVACDGEGRIFVADRSGSRVQSFDREGSFLGVLFDADEPSA